MKHLKKSIMLFVAAVFCMIPFFASSLTVQAQESVTYFLKYVDNDWRYQTGSWDDNGSHRELYYLHQSIKDGDIIVIDDSEHDLKLEVNVRLSNLTVVHSPLAIITAKGIDNVYVINSSTCAINGDVNYAEVYDASACNFNNNLGTLKVLSESHDDLRANVTVLGTLDYVYASGKSYKHFELYNFAKNSFCLSKGVLTTDKSKFSDTPQTTTTPSTSTNTNTGSSSNASSGEYDDVPKTGDVRFNPLWLVMIAGVCLAGAYRLKKN